jgi:hypothetical protein
MAKKQTLHSHVQIVDDGGELLRGSVLVLRGDRIVDMYTLWDREAVCEIEHKSTLVRSEAKEHLAKLRVLEGTHRIVKGA